MDNDYQTKLAKAMNFNPKKLPKDPAKLTKDSPELFTDDPNVPKKATFTDGTRYIYRVVCVDKRCEHYGWHYIGHTSNLRKRFNDGHFGNDKMRPDLDRFGWEAFRLELLETTNDPILAANLELLYIIQCDSVEHGYNKSLQTTVATGWHRTPESNAKRRAAISKKVWVFNASDLQTKRVTPEEAAALPPGWMPGRLTRSRPSEKNTLFTNTLISVGLIESMAIIATVVALIMLYANPLIH